MCRKAVVTASRTERYTDKQYTTMTGEKPIQCQVAVNHIVELTAEEKAEARQQAVRRYQDEELRKLQNRTKPTKAKTETQVQPSLFDFGL